ncbi:Peptidase C19 ubiquitin carboxyl-terminal hydrolase 2 [Neofusicoccum parvum]|uniref:Peptidase C19 ubiquitin carboxyl-terminal hydrolase 2 n=1 Tax=Neofusicoccum parvum TaxID=310453 RepID=A0ACB5RQZ1_9PEZI|nr:Peptidase C19 ubiquitin carboxyl-terminal hydrolase 2 [Neofusicoccum parvum]
MILTQSFLDEYWQKKTFHDLDDAEYTPGSTGRLDWTIPNYNGTKENPNKELVMKSPVVNVGGYDWQIKFYPRGNDSDFLSIYVECLTVAKKDGQASAQRSEETAVEDTEQALPSGKPQRPSPAPAPREYQQGPLPLLTEEPVPKRPSVAAQVSVVLYNPAEPRTNYYRQLDLDDIADALEWYGTDSCLSKLDVIEIWEILRSKMEFELADTSSKDRLKDLFGPERDRMMNVPTYRAPVKDCADIQTAIDKSINLVQASSPLPKILHIELERQEFNRESRSMRKLADKVKILEKVTINRTSYILYGFIVHKDSLQSGSYYSVVRPRGPGSKWYAYYDGKEENRVVCLTKRQAIEEHEGGGSEKSGVAYILMYVRQDVVPKQFSKDESKWEVPQWLKTSSRASRSNALNEATEETLDYKIIESAAFLEHEGPGIMDPSDPKWEKSPYQSTIKLPASSSARETRDALSQKFNTKDPRQIKFWFLDHANGTSHRPSMRGSGSIEDHRGDPDCEPNWTLRTTAENWPERRIWVHVVDFESLPELPKPIEPSVNEVPGNANNVGPALDHGGDSPMSDVDDGGNPTDEQMDLVITEGLAAQAARQHPVDVTNDLDFTLPRPPQPLGTLSNDTDMANNMEAVQSINDNVVVITNSNLSPFDFAIPPPMPHIITATQYEIYYFLKTFDPESQTLKAQKTVVAKKNDRIDHSVLDALDQPHDTPIDIYEEEGPTIATKLQRQGSITFSQASIHSTAVLIVQTPLTSEQCSALADRALFSDPVDYVQHSTSTRFATTSTPLTGHFTMDYFSSEHFMGMLVRGRPHGHGRRLYFDGGEYVGAFRLGQRHGHGRLTHPNGDIYEGEWAADLAEGRGSFIEAATGNSYLGGWKAGKKFGEGVTHWKNAQEVERLCRICWEESADAAFYDCGHVVACLGCARRVDTCPVCRRRVLSAMKLFFGN